MTAKAKRASSTDEIPVWSVEVLEDCGYVQYHLRLSHDVARGLAEKLRGLLAKKEIGGFQVRLVEALVVPAFMFYKRYGFDK